MKKIRPLIILLGFVLPLSSLAAGLQISPTRLSFSLPPESEKTQSIIVANPTADVQIYEITADDYPNYIKPVPKSFTLESGARKEIAVTVLSQGPLSSREQKIVTNLSVVAKPLTAESLTVGTGAKIQMEITITDSIGTNKTKFIFLVITLAVITVLVIGFIILKRKQKV